MMIIPNIYRVIGNRGCNSYVLETKLGLIIIDSGYLGSEQAIIKYLDAQLGASPEDVAYIIVTHSRRNCVESAVDLLTYCEEAKLIIHQEDFESFKRFTLLSQDFENIEIMNSDAYNIDNEVKVIFTPGFTPGSISIIFRDALFIGGLVYIDQNQRVSLPLSISFFHSGYN